MITVSDKDLYFAKMREGARIPTKKDEDAGYDFYPCFEQDFFVIMPGETKIVPTGIATAFSKNYYMQIEERSSFGKMGIKKNGGVFDSGYRGEYLIATYNTTTKPFIITKLEIESLPKTFVVDGKKYKKSEVTLYPYNKAFCQAVMHVVPAVESKEISYEELCKIKSERGTGNFGHSGK